MKHIITFTLHTSEERAKTRQTTGEKPFLTPQIIAEETIEKMHKEKGGR